MNLVPEIWRSDQNKEEIHLFVEGTCGEYVLGFNPNIVNTEDVRKLLLNNGFDLPLTLGSDAKG